MTGEGAGRHHEGGRAEPRYGLLAVLVSPSEAEHQTCVRRCLSWLADVFRLDRIGKVFLGVQERVQVPGALCERHQHGLGDGLKADAGADMNLGVIESGYDPDVGPA